MADLDPALLHHFLELPVTDRALLQTFARPPDVGPCPAWVDTTYGGHAKLCNRARWSALCLDFDEPQDDVGEALGLC
jgi:hypothetical protein